MLDIETKIKPSSGDWQTSINRDRVQLSASHQTLELKSAISAILDETSSEDPTVLTSRAIALTKYLDVFMDGITTRERYSGAKLKTALEKLPRNPLLKTAAQKTAKFIKASESSGVDMLSRQAMVGGFINEAVNFIKVE